ncbi:MAG: type II secretion system protein [Rhodocyclaceae bacterium]|nr:type II secretion system protein [Rhodocyclaceae bacterium]
MTRVTRLTRGRDGDGFTLVEMIVFIVIVSVALTGVLLAFNTTIKSSADPLITKQVLRVAEGIMQEVLKKQYQNDPADATNSSATLGCTPTTPPLCRINTPADRANYNDVDDYSGFSQTGITQLDGTTAVSGLSTYSFSIAIDKTAAGATLGALTGGAPNEVKKITVTVSGGNQSLTLVGYRTNYGY